MKRTILLIFAFLILMACSRKNREIQETTKIPFEWSSFELNGNKYEHGAMIIPFSFENVPKQFSMQFDLGLDVNVVYENCLDTIIKNYPEFTDRIITLDDGYRLLKTSFLFDDFNSENDTLFLYPKFGDITSFDKLDRIGSIGVNQVENKILIIDFPNQSMEIKESMSYEERQNFSFVDLEIKNRKLIISLNVDGKSKKFYYDTGSSITPIATTEKSIYDEICGVNKTNEEMITASSWGEEISIYGADIKREIRFNELILNTDSSKMYYVNAKRIVELNNNLGVENILGNEFFIEKVIAIDLTTNRFGVKTK